MLSLECTQSNPNLRKRLHCIHWLLDQTIACIMQLQVPTPSPYKKLFDPWKLDSSLGTTPLSPPDTLGFIAPTADQVLVALKVTWCPLHSNHIFHVTKPKFHTNPHTSSLSLVSPQPLPLVSYCLTISIFWQPWEHCKWLGTAVYLGGVDQLHAQFEGECKPYHLSPKAKSSRR